MDAAATILRREGAGGVSVQRIADAAGTSKGLVHYHFAGKDALLAACADRLAAELVDVQLRAVSAASAASVLDDLWAALAAPPARGAHRALLALAADASPATSAAFARAQAARRACARETVATIERRMGLRLSVPRGALADAFVALADGLAVAPDDDRSRTDARAAYDAFWLAVLSLGT